MSQQPTSQTLTIDQAIDLALTQHRSGQLAQAESLYRQILQHVPDHPVALQYLGVLEYQRGRLDEAEKLMLRSIELLPNLSGYYNNLGEVYRAMKRLDQAQKMFDKALSLEPNDYHTTNNLALLYLDQNRLQEARPLLDKAIQLQPNNPTAICNLGVLQEKLGEFEAARQTLQRAIELSASMAPAYINLCSVLNALDQPEQALSAADAAIRLSPQDPMGHLQRSNVLFHSGRLKEAWPEYDWRLKKYPFLVRQFLEPQWDGSDLKGKTILLFCEQGYGDAIQFVRFAELVAQRGAGKVILESLPALLPLFSNIAGVDEVVCKGQVLPKYDVQCSLVQLPGLLQTELTTIPNRIPYLHVDPSRIEHWAQRLKSDGPVKLRVGLAWAGSPAHEKDLLRSAKLSDFAPLAKVADVAFYSLQKGVASEQAFNPPAGMKLIDHTLILTDFAESAALVMNLDLVISVDTAAAHLAGALGKPVRTMLPLVPEWRWMKHRMDSPWYPTMRLFRQSRFADWTGPVEQIVSQLHDQVA